jgi:hypothetical protein
MEDQSDKTKVVWKVFKRIGSQAGDFLLFSLSLLVGNMKFGEEAGNEGSDQPLQNYSPLKSHYMYVSYDCMGRDAS